MSADPGQLALNELWVCTTCDGRGRIDGKQCPTCQGAGTLEFDPKDYSDIPF